VKAANGPSNNLNNATTAAPFTMVDMYAVTQVGAP